MKAKSKLDKCIVLHRLQRQFQQRNRFVGGVYGTKLTPLHAHILLDIESYGSASPSGLARSVMVPASYISRGLKELGELKFVNVGTAYGDRRGRKASLTSAGIEVMRTYHNAANETLRNLIQRLSEREVVRLGQLLHQLAEGLNAPSVKLNTVAHPLREAIARVTRGLGLVGGRLQTKYGVTPLQFHILAECSSQECLAIELVDLFHVSPNTISAAIKSLEERRLVLRTSDSGDARRRRINNSASGNKLLLRIEEGAAQQLTEALNSSSETELDELIELFSKALTAQEILLQPKLEIRQPNLPEERDQARHALIRILAHAPSNTRIPEIVVGSESLTFTLEVQGEPGAFLEFQPTQGRWRMVLVAPQSSAIKAEHVTQFVERAVSLFILAKGRSHVDLNCLIDSYDICQAVHKLLAKSTKKPISAR